jgi:hypothetical protein
MRNFKQGPVTDERWVLGRTIDAHKIISKIDLSGFVPVEEVYKSQINIVRTYAIYSMVPIGTVRTRVSADHNRNSTQGHDMKMCDGLDPRETIPIGGQEYRRTVVMTTVSQN